MRVRLFILFVFFSKSILAFETELSDSAKTFELKFKSDFMSQHLWRGYAMSTVPSFEPTVELSNGILNGGFWGALSADGKYFEIDTYLKVEYNGFSIGLIDYFCPGSITSNQQFFNYSQNTTKHTLDLHAEYQGFYLIPIRLLVATMIYGDDINSITNKNYYSTYLELATFSTIKSINMEYFLGFNLFESYYGNKPSLINAGVKTTGNVSIFKKSTIDVQASIITNPLINKVYIVLGFSL